MTQSNARTIEAFARHPGGAGAGAAALRKGVSAAARTGQTIGIEWVDYLKQFTAEAAAATEKVVKAGSPARAMEIQGAFVKASTEQFAARAATFRDLYATLVRDLTEPFAAPAGRKAV